MTITPNVIVDRDTCVGTGVCRALASAHFVQDGMRTRWVDAGPIDKDLLEEILDSCPVGAIETAEETT